MDDSIFLYGVMALTALSLINVFMLLFAMRDRGIGRRLAHLEASLSQAKCSDDNDYINELECLVQNIAFYAGNYGAWKAQQEFRDIVSSFNSEIKNPHHFAAVDSYFDKLVGGIDSLSPEALTRLNIERFTLKRRGGRELIKAAKGDDFYNEITQKNPEIIQLKDEQKETSLKGIHLL